MIRTAWSPAEGVHRLLQHLGGRHAHSAAGLHVARRLVDWNIAQPVVIRSETNFEPNDDGDGFASIRARFDNVSNEPILQIMVLTDGNPTPRWASRSRSRRTTATEAGWQRPTHSTPQGNLSDVSPRTQLPKRVQQFDWPNPPAPKPTNSPRTSTFGDNRECG